MFLTSVLDAGGGQHHASVALSQGKDLLVSILGAAQEVVMWRGKSGSLLRNALGCVAGNKTLL
jgi:hypothetical protein